MGMFLGSLAVLACVGNMAKLLGYLDGHSAGHSADALKTARRKLGLAVISEGFPRITYWLSQSEQPVGATPVKASLTAPTAPTERRGEYLTPPTTLSVH